VQALQITAKMPSEAMIQVIPVTTAEVVPGRRGRIGAALHPAQTACQRQSHQRTRL